MGCRLYNCGLPSSPHPHLEDQDFLSGFTPLALEVSLHRRQQFPFYPGKMGAPSATFAIPQAPYSAICAVGVFAVTLARGPYKVLPAGASWAKVF